MSPSSNQPAIPRLLPGRPLPSRTYIPGRTAKLLPSEYQLATKSEAPADWQQSPTYRWACELFNHGYYWEAHEVWEGLWHGVGRVGPDADFLKGLIKLAAAGVKAREGRPEGVVRHCRRAMELLQSLPRSSDGNACNHYGGLSLSNVIRVAEQAIASRPVALATDEVSPLFDLVLMPDANGGSP